MSKSEPHQTTAYIRLPNGQIASAIPEPFFWGLLPWLWKRLTGWRDAYGRPAQRMTWRG